MSEDRIKELEEQLQMETMVKKSEVMLNKELQERIEKLEERIKEYLRNLRNLRNPENPGNERYP